MTPFSELETDALTELVNIAVSGAASRLRGMVGAEVLLNVPHVAVVRSDLAASTMESLGLATYMGVSQAFGGQFSGQALLVFPSDNYRDFVRSVIGDMVGDDEIEALIPDALGEVGNVLLLGFLSGLGNMLEVVFEVATPQVHGGRSSELFAPDSGHEVVLFVYINFMVRGQNVRGYLALLLGLASFELMRGVLGRFIDGVTGGPGAGGGRTGEGA